MHVLVIDNPEAVQPRQWGELYRLGRLHYDGANGGELFLELPYPRRQMVSSYKKVLSGQGLHVRGAYRPLPAHRIIELPVRRLSPLEYNEPYSYGGPTGTLVVGQRTATCSWCNTGEMRAASEQVSASSPHPCRTILFCPTCRRLTKVAGWYDPEDWPDLVAFVANAPRVAAQYQEGKRFWREAIRQDIAGSSPAKKRMLGIGGGPKAKDRVTAS